MSYNRAIHQSIDFTPDFPFEVLGIREGEYEEFIYCHWHQSTEIILVESGYLSLEIDQRVYHLGPGDLAFVNPEEIHYGLEQKGTSCRILAFVFDWTLLPVRPDSTFYRTYLEPLISIGYTLDSVLYARDSADSNQLLIRLLQQIYQEYMEQPAYYKECILSEMMRVLIELYRNDLIDRHQMMRAQNQNLILIKNALRYIEEHYRERIYFPQIASLVSMSEDYFYKVFKKTTGQTPSHYLRFIRIQRAKELLRTTDLSISKIGEEVGYESTSYFIKQFHQMTGQTPKQFQHGVL